MYISTISLLLIPEKKIKFYKRREIFKHQFEELTNYYGIVPDEKYNEDHIYELLFLFDSYNQPECILPRAVDTITGGNKVLAHKKEIETLVNEGFNKTMIEYCLVNLCSSNILLLDQMRTMVTIFSDPTTNRNFKYLMLLTNSVSLATFENWYETYLAQGSDPVLAVLNLPYIYSSWEKYKNEQAHLNLPLPQLALMLNNSGSVYIEEFMANYKQFLGKELDLKSAAELISEYDSSFVDYNHWDKTKEQFEKKDVYYFQTRPIYLQMAEDLKNNYPVECENTHAVLLALIRFGGDVQKVASFFCNREV